MMYNYYKFEEPCLALLIAKSPEAALLEYQEEIADIQEGVSFEEVSQEDCLEILAQQTTDEMPTIECGLTKAAFDIQESLFCLVDSGREAIILNASQSMKEPGRESNYVSRVLS